MTVSRVINNHENVSEKTRKRVMEKVKSMGYTPNHVAKSLVSNRTYTIGMVIPEISHAFFPEVVRGIEEVTHKSEYQLILTHAAEQFSREQEAIQTLRSKRVDGILISSSQTVDDYTFYEELIRNGPKVVFFDRCIENIGASCISVNDRASAFTITEHLISHGYSKIGYLSGPERVSIGRERFRGFSQAMEAHGIAVERRWITESGFNEEGGYRAMKKILELPEGDRPEAIASVNDPAAFGAMEAMKEAGVSVPGDMAIVGFTDDVRAELLTCPLTTIRQPAYEVGKRAVEKLLRAIENKDEPIEYIEIATTMMIRNSCGCRT